MTPHEDEYFGVTSHNVKQVVVDNIVNNLQSVEVKKVAKRESTPKRKMAHVVEGVEEDVNNNLNYIEVPLNKKSNDIVIRKKAELVAQDYAQIKGVDFVEASSPITRLEAIKLLLRLFCLLLLI